MSAAKKVVCHDIKAEKNKLREFFNLAERFRNSTDPKEAGGLGDELGRMVFGS